MQYYQHRFEHVEDYLHHRQPYLMVDKIVSITSGEIRTEKSIAGNEFFAEAHFPGAAVFPGAMMQELCTQSAGILIAANYNPMPEFDTSDPHANRFALGVLARVNNARYRSFARIGDTLQACVNLDEHTESVFDFSATLTVKKNEIASLQFRLTNIESELLQAADSGGAA